MAVEVAAASILLLAGPAVGLAALSLPVTAGVAVVFFRIGPVAEVMLFLLVTAVAVVFILIVLAAGGVLFLPVTAVVAAFTLTGRAAVVLLRLIAALDIHL